MGYNFIYFNKEKAKKPQADVNIMLKKKKNGETACRISFSNVPAEDIAKTGYVRFAVPENDKNKLFFFATDKDKGYKLTIQVKTMFIETQQENIVELMKRFEGKYELEITEENYVFIDRRNAV